MLGPQYGVANLERELQEMSPADAPAADKPAAKGDWPTPIDRDVMIALLLRRKAATPKEVASALSWKPGMTPQKADAALKRLRQRGLLKTRGGQYAVTKELTQFTHGFSAGKYAEARRVANRALSEVGRPAPKSARGALESLLGTVGDVVAHKNERAGKADYSSMSISQLAREIRKHWKKIGYGAKPYLSAMSSMDKISDSYGQDPGSHIVNYFLGNANAFRGPEAKAIKAELKKRVKQGR